MEKFINKIKEVLIKAKEEYAEDLDVMGYVETLRQNKKDIQKTMKEVLDGDELKEKISVTYKPDETNGYTNGSLVIVEKYLGVIIEGFRIILAYTNNSTKYCNCKPTDKGYNEKHKCCGIDCDWHNIPVVEVCGLYDEYYITRHEFKGTQKDLWNIQDGIVEETEQEKAIINEIRKLQNDNLKYINEIANNIYEINEKLNKLQRAM